MCQTSGLNLNTCNRIKIRNDELSDLFSKGVNIIIIIIEKLLTLLLRRDN